MHQHAQVLAATEIGKPRTALYPSHAQEVIMQFQSHWQWNKASQKWTIDSIRKTLSGIVHAINKPKGLTKAISTPKARETKKKETIRTRQSSTAAVKDEVDDNVAASTKFVAINKPLSPLSRVDSIQPSIEDRPIKVASQKLMSPLSRADSTKSTPDVRYNSIASIQTDTSEAMEDQKADEQSSVKLLDIIVVIKPSLLDPWDREMISFPLWRCQVPVKNKDAAPENLQDWRDLSFADFVRQLKGENAISEAEVIVWGQYNQMVTSDLTFAGAVQEQLQEARTNGLAHNDVSFAVATSKSIPGLMLRSSCTNESGPTRRSS